ncbi:MAG: UPF0182 family protein [Spirochaetales bacterium]|nr:UPF0182 family protein [Spirochaetales bacterium]
MIAFLNILWILVGCIPLGLTLLKWGKADEKKLKNRLRLSIIVIGLDIILLILINIFFHFYAELLWYESVSYVSRFLTANITIFLLFMAGWILSFLFLTVCIHPVMKNTLQRIRRVLYRIGLAGVALIFGIVAANLWELFLQFVYQAPSTLADPLWGIGTGFYMFSLPFFYEALQWIVWLVLTGAGLMVFLHFISQDLLSGEVMHSGSLSQEKVSGHMKKLKQPLLVMTGCVLLCMAAFTILDIFSLMLTQTSVVSGIGFVEANFRVLAMICTAVLYALAAAALIITQYIPPLREKLVFSRINPKGRRTIAKGPAAIIGVAVLAVLILNTIVPEIVTSLVLKPNEITLEQPYLKNNIIATQTSFKIDSSSVTSNIIPVNPDITPEIIAKNRETINNVRLWDWNALKDNLKEQQEIRLYYEFHDVDIDRYKINNEYRQVMLSVREMEKSRLDINSQTWVSRHLKYTHGYGLTLLPANSILPQGKPKLFIKNIPPQSEIDITITRPEIYYGERTSDHVYVNTTEEEFDYPEGENNVYSQYKGTGGVLLDTFLKRLALAWKYDGNDQLFSSYLTPQTRILFRRHIIQRAGTLAPFLSFDGDPYAVITNDGRIVYIIDAYFTSYNYPYAQRYDGTMKRFQGINYIRNSVKVVVDAFNGSVDFYIMDETDIMVQTYKNIYPDLFLPFEAMPVDIKSHLRYPETLFTIQAEMYQTFHMDDPDVFYQREDMWAFATERYRANFQIVIPYYVMVQFPGNPHAEFILMVPFTPQGKNVINAWMAARCDVPNYGQLIVYRFPKGIEVLGPRQVEARIDQNAEMSQAMTLWGQRGSEVIRGNLLTIPLFSNDTVSLFYVEPIFLQAEDAKLPELRRIALGNQNNIVWAERFETALDMLLEGRTMAASQIADEPGKVVAAVETGNAPPDQKLLNDIAAAFRQYKKSMAEEDYSAAGRYLDQLNSLLEGIE